MIIGRRIEVRGSVQGVGFRPWVWRLARELGVGGRVRDDSAGVTLEAFAEEALLEELIARIRGEHPPSARIVALTWADIEVDSVDPFAFVASDAGGAVWASIPPDLATCEACLREVFDPDDRRYLYPFTNCTDCGPRFAIAFGVPYARSQTSMAPFPLCADCQREVDDPTNRRFHAQPNACPVCGPTLAWHDAAGVAVPVADALAEAISALRDGKIVAVKGLGGFHLACDATNRSAVDALRSRERREDKPFAVMVADLDAARAIAVLSPADEALLTSVERPITLLPWSDRAALAPEVAPDAPRVGLFLPYTPLHHLLAAGVGRPLVMTSGRRSGEPIVHTLDHAVHDLKGIADGYLTHDREIAARTDDSVAAVIADQPVLLRRSRGWVPPPIPVPVLFHEPILAVGGDRDSACCVGYGDEAFLGPHVGDLASEAGWHALGAAVDRMERLLGVRCAVVAHDLHPGYLPTRWADERDGLTLAIQHHYAHVAGALAAAGLTHGIGVAYDAGGYGTDGTSWGAEVLVAGAFGLERVGTWRPIALSGGDRAILEPWRAALAWLIDAYDGAVPDLPLRRGLPPNTIRVVRHQLEADGQAPPARGMGRRFAAIAAIALQRPAAGFEGQLASAWEAVAAGGIAEPYPFHLDAGAIPWEVDDRATLRAAVDDLLAGVPVAVVSARFHATVIAATAEVIAKVRRDDVLPVVLSGGCFANARLVEGLIGAVDDVRLPRDVPPGDGGLSLGQAVIANAIVGDEMGVGAPP